MSLPLEQHTDNQPVLLGGAGCDGDVDAAGLRARMGGIAKALGAHSGERVVLACADRLHFTAGLLAAWSLGLEVWLPHNVQASSVHGMAATAGVRTLLHDRDEGEGIDVRTVEPDAQAGAALTFAAPRMGVVVHTSGSSGEPQAHHKSWEQLHNETRALCAHFGIGGERIVATVPPHHIYGLLFGVLVPLCSGGATSRLSPLLPADVVAALDGLGAAVLISVPAQLRALAEAGTLGEGRVVFSSGAPLPARTGEVLRAAGARVIEVLGSTETGGIASRDGGAVWAPLPGVDVGRSDEGTLQVRSPWLHAEEPQPRACADRIELVDGGFQHLGRADRVVKIGGRRMDLSALETALVQLDGVRDARVVASDTGGVRGTQLLAAVEVDMHVENGGVDGAGKVTPEGLRRALCERFEAVTVPRRYRVVASLPRTGSGKVSDAEVRELFGGGSWELKAVAQADGDWRFTLPEGLGYFRGHFEGFPVLPGVVQLSDMVLERARFQWPDLGALRRLTRVKFKRPMRPGEELVLSLKRPKPNQVRFELRFAGASAGSGILHFEESAS